MRMMMSDPFFDMPLPRMAMRPHRLVMSRSTGSHGIPTDSSGYASASSSSSLFEDSRPNRSASASSSTTVQTVSEDDATLAKSARTASQEEVQSESKARKLEENLIKALDELDARVAFLRETANELEEEKQKLLVSLRWIERNGHLDQIKPINREEVLTNTSRLLQTLETVTVHVVTRRTAEQEAAVQSVYALLDRLEKQLKSEKERNEALKLARVLLNTCSSGSETLLAIDDKFQKQVIACAGKLVLSSGLSP